MDAAKLASPTYSGAIEFEIVEQHPDRVVGRMNVQPGILNPFGTVHAGAMVWFADVCATRLAIGDAKLGEGGAGFQLAIDLHTVLLGNRRDGALTAEARFVRQGKRVSVVRIAVTGPDGRLLMELTSTHVPAG